MVAGSNATPQLKKLFPLPNKHVLKKTHSHSISQISTISEYNELDIDTDRSRTTLSTKKSLGNNAKVSNRISLESMTVYLAANKYITEPVSFYNHFIIDLSSQTSDGQTVMHLACRYGKYDMVKLLLKKYGSNEMDINQVDFKVK